MIVIRTQNASLKEGILLTSFPSPRRIFQSTQTSWSLSFSGFTRVEVEVEPELIVLIVSLDVTAEELGEDAVEAVRSRLNVVYMESLNGFMVSG